MVLATIASLNVGNDIGSRIEQIKEEDLVSDVGWYSDSLDVCDDISSRTEQKALSTLGMIMYRVPLRI